MAKGGYFGVAGAARKLTKGYFSPDGAARRIIKAYIGIGGVARPCWSEGRYLYKYYGEIPASGADWSPGAEASAEGVSAVFAGGSTSAQWSNSNRVEMYNSELKNSTLTGLQYGKLSVNKGVSVGDYALFAGGETLVQVWTNTRTYSDVSAYNSAGTRTAPSNLTTQRDAAVTVETNGYALIAGGEYFVSIDDSHHDVDTVESYSSTLSKSTATALTETGVTSSGTVAATCGKYALIQTSENVMDVYNGRSKTKTLTPGVKYSYAGSVTDGAVFVGSTRVWDNDTQEYVRTMRAMGVKSADLSMMTISAPGSISNIFSTVTGSDGSATFQGYTSTYNSEDSSYVYTWFGFAYDKDFVLHTVEGVGKNLRSARAGDYIVFASGGTASALVLNEEE